VAGAGFDIAGALLLVRGLTTSPEQAAWRIVQGQNTFDRFSVRTAEDYADGWLGRLSLVVGFLIQAIAYVLSAHSSSQLSRTPWAYLGLFICCAAPILVVLLLAKHFQPRLRNRWLIELACIDDYGYRQQLPSDRELFGYGRILRFRPYQAEFGDQAAYARRVFKTEVRDSSKDHETRPPEFQPYAALDDEHGYVAGAPRKRRWRLPRRS
jgi:hypothetical protein